MLFIYWANQQMILTHRNTLHKICNVEFSPAPYFELEEEFSLQQKIAELINKKLIQSAHDISEGGLFVTFVKAVLIVNLDLQ